MLDDPMQNQTIHFRAPINGHTGYGLHACQIVSDMQRLGYPIKIHPIEINETYTQLCSARGLSGWREWESRD